MRACLLIRIGAKASLEMFLAKYPPPILLASWIPRVIFQTLFFVFLVKFALGSQAVQFALVGNAIAIAAAVALVQIGSILGEDRQAGFLPYLLAAPANHVWVILGRCATLYFDAVLSSLLALFAVGAITGTIPEPMRVLYALPAFLLICITLAAMGLLIGSLALLTRSYMVIANFLYYVMLILCGVNYPLKLLPPSVQIMGQLLPMTHGLDAVRALLMGSSYASVASSLAMEALIGVIYSIIAYLVFQYQRHLAWKKGSTEFV